VAGALFVARKAGYDDILTLDMGGTSTDVALCQNGQADDRRETSIGQFRIKVPSVNVHTVGAGGGSIAHVPELDEGAPRRTPIGGAPSAGPAAYGKGGRPADRDGRERRARHLPPQLLGGEMQLDVDAAAGGGAENRGRDGARLARNRRRTGSSRSSTRTWPARCRLVSVQRGHDPRDFALVAYGGAGPLHANALAKLMGSFPVIVPPAPGLLCAIGDLVADFRDEFAQTYIRLVADASGSEIAEILDRSRRAGDPVARGRRDPEGQAGDRVQRRHALSPPGLRDPGRARAARGADRGADPPSRSAFNGLPRAALRLPHARYRLGDRQPARGRVRRRPEAGPADGGRGEANAMGAVVDEHDVLFDGQPTPTRIYDRARLRPGR